METSREDGWGPKRGVESGEGSKRAGKRDKGGLGIKLCSKFKYNNA